MHTYTNQRDQTHAYTNREQTVKHDIIDIDIMFIHNCTQMNIDNYHSEEFIALNCKLVAALAVGDYI